MKKFIKEHPVISCLVGLVVVTGLAVFLGWITGGPATAGRFGSIAFGSFIFYGIVSWLINTIIAKTYEKKTGKSIEELIEQEEKEAKKQERKKEKYKEDEDDYDDGL